MKKFSIIIILALSLFSCSDDRLGLNPEDRLPLDVLITTPEDMGSALIGMYNEYNNKSTFATDILVAGDLLSDNTFVSQTNDGYYNNANTMSLSQDINDFGTTIDGLYNAIALSNAIINSDITGDNVNRYKAEAYTGRALSLFYAVNFYSADIKSGLNPSYGVPIYTGDYNPDAEYPRSSVSEVYDQIISDLTNALTLFENVNPLSKSFFSATAAKHLLAKTYLTRGAAGDYQKVVTLCDEILNSSPSAFSLITQADYANYFTAISTENLPETIWEVEISAADNPGVNGAIGVFYAYNGQHRSLLFRQDFYNSFDASDVRKSLFSTSSVPSSDNPTGVWTKKHPRTNSEGNFTANTRIFRMSEVVLNRLEAMYHLGSGTTLTELNAFAASRGATTVYTGADLLNDILTERRKEFFAEGQRYFDLKRNAKPIVKTTNCLANCTVNPTDKLFVFPMPNYEMQNNALMTQYPGY